MKPAIVMTEGLEAIPLEWGRKQACIIESSWKNPEQLQRDLATADGLIVRTYTQVNELLLSQAPRLRAVGRAGVGMENIDQVACQTHGVKVFSTPGANAHAVCEYVFNLIFQLGRPVINLRQPVAAEEFHRYRKVIRGLELCGKTMGIIGMGRIGRLVGRAACAFGMNVLYNDVVDVAQYVDFAAKSVDKPALYAQADVISIHVSHRPGNRGMIDAAALAQCRPDSLLINTSRGEVIDAASLAAALRQNRVAGAALDVHDPEPPGPDYPLWGCPNCILAPHLAARTQGAMDAMSWVVRDVVEYLQAAAKA